MDRSRRGLEQQMDPALCVQFNDPFRNIVMMLARPIKPIVEYNVQRKTSICMCSRIELWAMGIRFSIRLRNSGEHSMGVLENNKFKIKKNRQITTPTVKPLPMGLCVQRFYRRAMNNNQLKVKVNCKIIYI